MTKKWVILLRLLDSFGLGSNFSTSLITHIRYCASKNIHLLCKVLIYLRSNNRLNTRLYNYIAAYIQPYLSGTKWGYLFYTYRKRCNNNGGIIYCVEDMVEITKFFKEIYKKNNLPNGMSLAFRDNLVKSSFEELSASIDICEVIKLCHPNPNESNYTYNINGEIVPALSAIIAGHRSIDFDIIDYLDNFGNNISELKEFCIFIRHKRNIIKQNISCVVIELFLERLNVSNMSLDLGNYLIESLHVAYNHSLNNLKTILGNGKTLIIYNNFSSMDQDSTISTCKSISASIASSISSIVPTDIIKFDLRAGYVNVNFTKEIKEAKIGCDTIQSSWELAVLLPQNYARVIILNDNSLNKNTVNYDNYLGLLGNPFVHHYNLVGSKKTIKKGKKHIHYGFPFNFYENLIRLENNNKDWNNINNLTF